LDIALIVHIFRITKEYIQLGLLSLHKDTKAPNFLNDEMKRNDFIVFACIGLGEAIR